jgi:hypothetical protein
MRVMACCRSKLTPRCLLWAGTAACATLLSASAASAQSPAAQPPAAQSPAPTPATTVEGVPAVDSAEVAKLVADLDNDRFATREVAQHRLFLLGAGALEAVGQAAAAGALESSTRAVNILLQWSQAEDSKLSLGALEQLAALTNRPAESSMAADKLADVREMAAMNEIVELGGRVEYDRQVAAFSGTPSLHVVILPKWKGGRAGLKRIGDVRRATTVSFYSAEIPGDDAAAELQEIKQLLRVEFYGTNVSEEALATLRAALPHATVDVRGGARLGIAEGQQTMPGSPAGAYVGEVQRGTAAEKAGLATNDIITEIAGVAVADFQALTREIAKVKPGESITMKVLRQGALGQPALEPTDVTVTFGRWGDEVLVNPNAASPLGGPNPAMPGATFLNQR